MREVSLLGLRLLDMEAEAIAALMAARPPSAPFAYLVTPNADHFVRLRRQPILSSLYAQATWRSLDSRAIAQAARLLGLHLPAVATGADILAILLDRHLRAGDRLTVIGLCSEGLAALHDRLPDVDIAHHAPPMGLLQDQNAFAAALAFASSHPARFTLLALGSPVQEMLAQAIASGEDATGIGLCIGAGLDFWLGRKCRAPRLMRRLGAEWLFRLAAEPERLWKRYLVDDWAILRFLVDERRQSREVRPPSWMPDPPV
ncbi:WecB/TagA/CpsF family glycosyltransferase [Acidisoma cellulosilytica]|uniref:WecB/TagA/CpsF family glycosyltransferase n=1 Tax=Acidisoma cellulosilyticum TaxID=2802395 RepID=A0A964E375_9PROT|nr:WecB/TagA/CpsF family glycosyltransferase [Acidisoma cellulosilyticum]MCB8879558.1 WecB/TagA/CpsF family glycosyltransferase [Acidisoma cellulosilyticum]